jgi:CRP-like cAMP-binding protein
MPLKIEELAQMIAVSRQHLTKLLHELERDGILWRDKGWFIIPEPERLWHWTDY